MCDVTSATPDLANHWYCLQGELLCGATLTHRLLHSHSTVILLNLKLKQTENDGPVWNAIFDKL